MTLYFDHNATSPLRPQVQEALKEFLTSPLANPSSIHGSGRKARRALDSAREEVAQFVGANPSEIIFTSGGTEANQLAWNAFSRPGAHIATSRVEHSSVLNAAKRAEDAGAAVRYVSVGTDGQLSKEDLESIPTVPPEFLSIQHANNETGILYPIETLARACKTIGTAVHSDAVQSVGKTRISIAALSVDLLSISGHKLGALTGVGALVVRKGSPYEPVYKGKHEKGRRAGTENLIGIVSMAAACRAIREQGDKEIQKIRKLRDTFERELRAKMEGLKITGDGKNRLPNTSHMCLEEVDGESLLIAADLEGICCSTGAACSSGSISPSHVLLAMGWTPEQASGSLRFSFGWNTTEDDIQCVIERLPKLVAHVRQVRHNKTTNLDFS